MKFFVTFQMPHTGLDQWLAQPEAERKSQDEKMKSDWDAWMSEHKGALSGTAGVGKPKRVTAEGVEDSRNDLMMYTFVEAESLDAATALFVNHPHFGIPGAWVEVMPVNENVG